MTLLGKMVLQQPIEAQAVRLDDGWDVSLFGGRTHVGAIAMADVATGEVQILQRAGHREGDLVKQWAEVLMQKLSATVTVRCGIHYDQADACQISVILRACDGLLEELISILQNDKEN